MKKKLFRLYAFTFTFFFVLTLGILFTNAGEVRIQSEKGAKIVMTWIGQDSLFSFKGEPGPACDVQSGSWVVLVDVEGLTEGDSTDIKLTKVDTGEAMDLGTQSLPLTVGDCDSAAAGGQVKVCFEEESGYEYRIDVGEGQKVSFIREPGCEAWPQRVKVAGLEQ